MEFERLGCFRDIGLAVRDAVGARSRESPGCQGQDARRPIRGSAWSAARHGIPTLSAHGLSAFLDPFVIVYGLER
jgi:hypothetical protein